MVTPLINIYNIKPLENFKAIERSNISISPNSKYGDLVWDLSSFEQNPNVKPSSLVLRFDFKLDAGNRLSDAKFSLLRETCKEVLYAMASAPKGKLPSPPTLKKRYTALRFFINWLVSNYYVSIGQLTPEDINKFILLVRGANVHPMTKVNRVDVLKHLWRYRKHLSDPLKFDVLKGESVLTVTQVTKEQYRQHRYDFIPDELCQDLIRACISFIRDKGVEVATAIQLRDNANLNEIRKDNSRANRNRAKTSAIQCTGFTNSEITTLSRQLLACCYVVINFFTGIRASEMLSLSPDQIYLEGGIAWVIGKQFKIDKKSKKWMAPNIVFEAFNLAKSLTQSMRESIDYELDNVTNPQVINQLKELKSGLFLNWSKKREHGYLFTKAPQVSNIKSSIQTSLKELVKLFNIVDENGELWNLHPHQFRKSFVRFICASAMNIRYLQEHMGHKSLDMTAWYDTDDVELTEEIAKQLKQFKTEKLNPIFNKSQKITGAGSESLINENRDYYVGIATIKSKDSFISNLADDITLRDTGHSWCMGDSSNGNCTGVVGCMMDISMTQKCKSALITEEHLPAWQKIKERNVELLDSEQLGLYQKDVLRKVITEVIDPTIKALSNNRD